MQQEPTVLVTLLLRRPQSADSRLTSLTGWKIRGSITEKGNILQYSLSTTALVPTKLQTPKVTFLGVNQPRLKANNKLTF
jgi:hypothetical protein